MYTHMYTDTHTYLPLRVKGLSALPYMHILTLPL